jgi:hypothetical protein
MSAMFGLFKRKSEIDRLEEKYQKLLKEAYTLSTSNRVSSDSKAAEAHDVLQRIEALRSGH